MSYNNPEIGASLYDDWQAFMEVVVRNKWETAEELYDLAVQDYVDIFETQPEVHLTELYKEWSLEASKVEYYETCK